MIASVTTKLEDRYYVVLEFTLEKGEVEWVNTCSVTDGSVTVVFRDDLSIKEIKYFSYLTCNANVSEKDLNSYRETARTTIKNFKEEHLS